IKRNHEVISSDNKGHAAETMEKEIRETEAENGFISAFAQSSAGDVTPNFVKHRWISEKLGPYRDAFKNKAHSGRLQKDHAIDLWKSAREASPLSSQLKTL